MSPSKPRTVAPPDPSIAIREQGRQNRVGQRTPFGSSLYNQDANGNYVVDTTFAPGMEALVNRQADLAMTDSRRQQVAPGLSQLASALMANYGRRYGLSADQLGGIDLSHGANTPMVPTGGRG